MSAIILTTHTPPRPEPTRMSTKQLTPQLRTTERTPLLSTSNQGPGGNGHGYARTVPLKETLSPTRFVTICIGIFSANFVFAFQTSSVPTLMSGISSGYGHAELGSYLGSVFTLANTAGTSRSLWGLCDSNRVVIPVYGVLMGSLGRKVAMLTAGLFYGLGTILCATSGSMYQLIAARAVAGVSVVLYTQYSRTEILARRRGFVNRLFGHSD
jgi:MFS family permease